MRRHLEAGAEVDERVDLLRVQGLTPLLFAVASGDPEIVELLVAAGADVNAADSEGTTPLVRAQGKGFDEVAAVLVANGAE